MPRTPEWNVYRQCVHCGRWRSLGYFQHNRHTCRSCYIVGVGYEFVAETRRNNLRLTEKGRRAIRSADRVA